MKQQDRDKLLTIAIGNLMIKKNSDNDKYPNVGEIIDVITPIFESLLKANEVEARVDEVEQLIASWGGWTDTEDNGHSYRVSDLVYDLKQRIDQLKKGKL